VLAGPPSADLARRVESIVAGIQSRAGDKLHCGCVVLVQRFTKALSVYPHLHVLMLDGGYLELENGTLTFVEDTAPTPAELRAIEDRVEARFGRWLKRNGFLDEEGPEEQELDGWWTAAASDPSGVLAPVGARRSSRWEVDARVRVAAGDEKGRLQLCLYVAPIPEPPLRGASMDHCGVSLDFVEPAVLEVGRGSPRRSSRCSMRIACA
jgi:hypothetical protein